MSARRWFAMVLAALAAGLLVGHVFTSTAPSPAGRVTPVTAGPAVPRSIP